MDPRCTPLVFLDIDGVLNSKPWFLQQRESGAVATELMGLYDLDPAACGLLQRLCEETGAGLVIVSTWRLYHPQEVLAELLTQRGVTAPILGMTPDLSRLEERSYKHQRGAEVQWWLDQLAPEIRAATRFVILDDVNDYGEDLQGSLVQTSMGTGLLPQHVQRAQEMLS